MIIDLYICRDDPRKVDKTNLEPIAQGVNIKLLEGSSMENPRFVLSNADYRRANYMFVPEFSRWYYLTPADNLNNVQWAINGRVDVLNSFKDSIRQLTAVVARQENVYNTLLNDGIFKTYQNPNYIFLPFPQGFTEQQFIFAVSGG